MNQEAFKKELEGVMEVFFASDYDDRPQKRGGMVTIRDTLHDPFHVFKVGYIEDDEYWRLCEKFSVEKAGRLLKLPEHISSWQSRNTKRKKFGGAVRGIHLIFSMSGLSEYGDEAVITVAAVKLGYMTLRRALDITKISNNPITKKLLVDCGIE